MIEMNKSILPNNQYNTAYRNAPAQLSNILGSRYSELTSECRLGFNPTETIKIEEKRVA